jgi:NAD-dependent deacetylase
VYVRSAPEFSYQEAASLIKGGRRTTAFTGAGISVESGIPPFRGEGGLWSMYDPQVLDIDFFHAHPGRSWMAVREIFYSSFLAAEPNEAHYALAAMEAAGRLHGIITQNIDNLHHRAGSKMIWEFHGNSRTLICLGCSKDYPAAGVDLGELPPTCRLCGGILKPDFVFFGEPIPEPAGTKSFLAAQMSDVLLVIGTTGEVMPAGMIPQAAKEKGAIIIEINTEESHYTRQITDVFLKARAAAAMVRLLELLGIQLPA